MAIENGERESTQIWRELLLEIKSQGINISKLVVGDEAMGLWVALKETSPLSIGRA